VARCEAAKSWHDETTRVMRCQRGDIRRYTRHHTGNYAFAPRRFDPDEITSYSLRHSSICRALLKGVPVSVVARLHDTSSREIEAHYAAYILDVAGDALSRKSLLQPARPATDNVVPLAGRQA
jgi:hypothetical protein